MRVGGDWLAEVITPCEGDSEQTLAGKQVSRVDTWRESFLGRGGGGCLDPEQLPARCAQVTWPGAWPPWVRGSDSWS